MKIQRYYESQAEWSKKPRYDRLSLPLPPLP